MSSVTRPTPNPTSPAWSEYVDNQSFNLTGFNGKTITITLGQVNHIYYRFMCSVVTYGFVVGFTGMLMIVLLILADRKKIRRPIFILNFLCLLLQCLRGIVSLISVLSVNVYGLGILLFGAISQYPLSSYAPKQLVLGLLGITLYPCIFATLILQVRVVFAAEPRTQLIITVVLTILALVIEGFWLTYESIVLHNVYSDGSGIYTLQPYLYKTFQWSFIGFVSVCCLLFVYKLFHTIRRRRRMGFRSFGPLHILFIMFCQCLIIPRTPSAIFRIFLILYSYHLHYSIYPPQHIRKFPWFWANVPYRITSVVRYMGVPRIRRSRSARTCHNYKFLRYCRIIAFIPIPRKPQILQNL